MSDLTPLSLSLIGLLWSRDSLVSSTRLASLLKGPHTSYKPGLPSIHVHFTQGPSPHFHSLTQYPTLPCPVLPCPALPCLCTHYQPRLPPG